MFPFPNGFGFGFSRPSFASFDPKDMQWAYTRGSNYSQYGVYADTEDGRPVFAPFAYGGGARMPPGFEIRPGIRFAPEGLGPGFGGQQQHQHQHQQEAPQPPRDPTRLMVPGEDYDMEWTTPGAQQLVDEEMERAKIGGSGGQKPFKFGGFRRFGGFGGFPGGGSSAFGDFGGFGCPFDR